MRILLAGAAAIALSGCSFLGLGGNHDYKNHSYNPHTGSYGYQAHKPVKQSCNSNQCLSRWNLEAAVGPSFMVGGTAVTGDQANITGLNNIRMKDAYDTGFRAELGGSYALNPNRKITGNVFIDEAESSGRQDWGTIGGEALTGALSDYKSYGAELGLRQYFAPRRGVILKSIRPYVEGKLGAARLDDVRIQGSELGGATFSAADVPFYESGWVGTAAGMIGVETPLTKYSTIALETGVRYTQGPKTDTSVLAPGFPIAGTNNGGSRTTIPVMLRGRYRF
jgi:hypothetical protein